MCLLLRDMTSHNKHIIRSVDGYALQVQLDWQDCNIVRFKSTTRPCKDCQHKSDSGISRLYSD